MNTATDVAQVRTRSAPPYRRVDVRSWVSEFVGTAALLFSAVTCSRWLFAPDSGLARVVTGVHWRMVIVGLVVGIVLSLLIVSPLGRRSGGHLNPAITTAFWGLGAFPRRDVGGYVAAQLGGSVAGTALARLVWGSRVSRGPVRFGVVQPEAGAGWPAVFGVEAASVVVLVALVAFLLARPELARWTPWAVGAMVGLIIAATGASTGGSFNPARALGPAVLSGSPGDLWCYLAAPVVGAVLATTVRAMSHRAPVLTCQLCGQLRPPA
jgi:glycerol uptake facilitator-like aquaporin